MAGGPGVVLDTSALLALLHGEPGAELVEEVLDGAIMSSVNWAEAVGVLEVHGVDSRAVRADVEALGIELVSFTADDADGAGAVLSVTRQEGLSLGDRACLSLARSRGLRAVTSDRVWAGLDLGIEITLIR